MLPAPAGAEGRQVGDTTREQACGTRAGELPGELGNSWPQAAQDRNIQGGCTLLGSAVPRGQREPRWTERGWLNGAEPGQTLPAAPHAPSSCQRPAQPTQLFFFFFLASASLLLPMLEWLVMLLRLEMLSEEFCRLMRSSGAGERSQGAGRDRERSGQTVPVPVPQPPGSSPQPTLRSLPFSPGPSQTPQRSEPPGKEDPGGTKPKISSQKHRGGKEPSP